VAVTRNVKSGWSTLVGLFCSIIPSANFSRSGTGLCRRRARAHGFPWLAVRRARATCGPSGQASSDTIVTVALFAGGRPDEPCQIARLRWPTTCLSLPLASCDDSAGTTGFVPSGRSRAPPLARASTAASL
jgi:hypothetical protein